MRIAARIILTLACLCVLTQQTGCVQAHQVRFRNHLDASVQPSKVNHSVIVVADR